MINTKIAVSELTKITKRHEKEIKELKSHILELYNNIEMMKARIVHLEIINETKRPK